MEFSRKLKILAGRHRYSQAQLALRLEVSQNLVSLWTRGKSIPDIYEAARIADLFGVDVNYLADDGLDEPPLADITPEERALVSVFRAKSLSFEEAVYRLESWAAPAPVPAVHGHGRVLSSGSDLTAIRLRRMQEEGTPKRPEPKPKEPPQSPKNRGRGGRSEGKR